MTSSKPRAGGREARPGFRCSECGWLTQKWVGRCGECQAWGTVDEVARPLAVTPVRAAARPAQPIAEVEADAAVTTPTGVDELDRVLGGGLVGGAVVLLAGEPGVGKSTLLLDVASRAAEQGRRVLYITGEESAAQVRLRAERIGAIRPRLLLAAETDLATVLGHVEAVSPDLLVVDSVQTVASDAVDGSAGGVSQVREVAASLIKVAKQRAMATVLVGHVTKDGSVAGPRVLEHLVDVVCQFEGDRHSPLRMVRAVKNRYGPTDEVGCFELGENGIAGLADPSGLFISRHLGPMPGTAVTVTLEGRRPFVAEVQGLVSPATGPSRRATSGLDGQRLAMVLAVLERSCGVPMSKHDVYAATVGGVRLVEPAADLALAMALTSSAQGFALPQRTVLVGEIGLAGEVRPVAGVNRRLAEASRLGFTTALVPAGTPVEAPARMVVHEVADLYAAMTWASEGPRPARPHKLG